MSGGPSRRDSADAQPPKRVFRSPNGRDWTVEAYAMPSRIADRGAAVGDPPTQTVLRFRSGDITLDLCEFPSEWESRTDDELVTLLRSANPPAFDPL